MFQEAPNWQYFDHGPSGLDYEKKAHDDAEGREIAKILSNAMRERGYRLPDEARYLGMGTGMAQPEIAFAQAMSVKPANVTLLDRNFGWEAIKRIKGISDQIQLVDNQGIWAFLQSPPVDRFDLVSLFGVDHKLTNQTMPHIIGHLPRILTRGGIVVIYPYWAERRTEWAQQGFTDLTSTQLEAYCLD